MKIKENVEKILSDSKISRGSDKYLMMMYWKFVDKIDFSNFENEFTQKATMPESIRRARQLIQEEGKYLPDDIIVSKRRKRQQKMRDAIVEKREVI